MKKCGDLFDTVTAALDGLEFIVESFNEATGNAVVEIVENVVPVALQGFDEAIVATN